MEERLGRLVEHVGPICGVRGADFAARVERKMIHYKDLYAQWLMENPVAHAEVQLPVWAGRKIQNMDVELFEAQFDLKLHVYALGRLAGINAAQCRAWSTYLWTSSRVPSPAAIASTVAGAV